MYTISVYTFWNVCNLRARCNCIHSSAIQKTIQDVPILVILEGFPQYLAGYSECQQRQCTYKVSLPERNLDSSSNPCAFRNIAVLFITAGGLPRCTLTTSQGALSISSSFLDVSPSCCSRARNARSVNGEEGLLCNPVW